MTLEAVIFGGMGSLAECAELDRAAWNAAFRMHDVPWDWSWDTYCELMRPGGDRQLAARYAAHLGEVLEAGALDATHQRLFAAMLAEEVPLRPGVARVLAWAARGGVKLAIVSRAELQPVSALLRATARARAGISFDVAVLRSDVTHMAPDPEAMHWRWRSWAWAPAGRWWWPTRPWPPRRRGARACRCWPSPDGWPRRSRSCSSGMPVAHALAPEALTRAWRDGLITDGGGIGRRRRVCLIWLKAGAARSCPRIGPQKSRHAEEARPCRTRRTNWPTISRRTSRRSTN
jgi:phosphoglycolate phosphatase-like HAD superfamily hydrolase